MQWRQTFFLPDILINAKDFRTTIKSGNVFVYKKSTSFSRTMTPRMMVLWSLFLRNIHPHVEPAETISHALMKFSRCCLRCSTCVAVERRKSFTDTIVNRMNRWLNKWWWFSADISWRCFDMICDKQWPAESRLIHWCLSSRGWFIVLFIIFQSSFTFEGFHGNLWFWWW